MSIKQELMEGQMIGRSEQLYCHQGVAADAEIGLA